MKEISGDITATYRLSFIKKLYYMAFNLIRGFFGLWQFIPKIKGNPDIKLIDKNKSTDTPGRLLINEFVISELPKIVKIGDINVLDIGCGSGYIRDLLSHSGFKGAYHGIDTSNYFLNEKETNFTSIFTKSKIEDFIVDRKYDFVISNTAFEHIENDLLASQKSKEACGENGVEVHIIPSFWSLFCYLLHGYRQYTPYRLKKIFGDRKNWCAYSLGGFFSFIFHIFVITIPERFTKNIRLRKKKWYPEFRNHALKLDKFLPICPLLYVVVIKH